MSENTNEREAFEAAFPNHYLGKFKETGDYINSETTGAWLGWQARAKQPEQPQAETAPVSQELLDYVARLEKAINFISSIANEERIFSACDKALASKPTKG